MPKPLHGTRTSRELERLAIAIGAIGERLPSVGLEDLEAHVSAVRSFLHETGGVGHSPATIRGIVGLTGGDVDPTPPVRAHMLAAVDEFFAKG
jgi:hypothetical protein